MAHLPTGLARRYVAWVRQHSLAIIGGHLAVLVVSVYLIAFRLPLFADFSYLLPQDAPAVVDLRKLEARVKTADTVLVVVTAPTSEARAAAAHEMVAGIRALPKDLVQQVEDDDVEIRAFLRAHRQIYVPLEDLVKARDALKQRIAAAKLAANPLYVDLEDRAAEDAAEPPEGGDATAKRELEDLRTRRRDAERQLDRSNHISADGKTAMIEVRIPFASTDVGRGKLLVAELDKLRATVIAAHPGVAMGYCGGNITALAEHAAISKGIVLSSIVTALLVALVLALYFRSATLLVLLIVTLAIASAAAFGAAALTVGHLNAATAFLGAIIAGNGVNYGILLIARYLEERKRHDVDEALAEAIVGTLRPTAVASLGASIAYGSLAATSFKGFADFAVIGAIGMQLCWIATFLLLPALLLRWGRSTRTYHGTPFVGATLVWLVGFRRPHVVCAVALALGVVASVMVVRYVASDPFEYDIKQLRSVGDDAKTARAWMKLSDDTFGRGYAGPTYIAADRPEQVAKIVRALGDRDPGRRVVGQIRSILDVVPEHQPEKIAVLGEIRTMLDDEALAALDDKERADLAELRPPDTIEPVTADMLPASIRELLTEKNGNVGLMIALQTSNKFDEWNGHDMIKFASTVRRLDLPGGGVVTTSGGSVIFADIIQSIGRDGPFVTLLAACGLAIMVVLLVGRNRRAAAVLVATVAGSVLMVAVCALLGLKVNFLDFVALPITLGLGVDYAINVAHRHDHDDDPDPLATLRTSGSAVFVCSLTTIIGYGSLLVSENLAIRGFGTASLIGEVTCVATALVVVPAMLALGRRTR
ncbi:MAG: exporters of the superfamily [Myxococcales bacterium]|nr:exporters of the superfamily [Myxococcales bacterium]